MSSHLDRVGHELWGNAEGLKTDHESLLVAGTLLSSGITDVQNAYGRSGLAKSPDLLHQGLTELSDMNRLLGTTGQVRDPLTTAMSETYARVPIIEDALMSVIVSPVPNLEARLSLVDLWVDAASTGKGRICPAKTVAKHHAASVVDEYARLRPDIKYLDEMVEILDAHLGNKRHFAVAAGAALICTVAGVRRIIKN